ncbi:hypothetical protein SAY87_030004 [Trapa incisa]|uniref:Uncharacterized protein n=1 Tax=Trapa incisa TaxID=236973 RepID=A0AAN7K7J7_9MYRT|nr:hypothetical protein SAY87_030004 [Trapa incisa]
MAVSSAHSQLPEVVARRRLGRHLGAVLLLLLLLLVSTCSSSVSAKAIVETLPGYSGKLPFKLETGYVTVGDMDEIELFYYFIESERNPVRDPLLLWLTGGPGCSGFSGLVYEIGPLVFDYTTFNGSFPSLLSNPHSWTQIASIIFLDAPVGTGFSYSTTQSGYYSSDTLSANNTYTFLRKWIVDHPRFSKVPLYISGDSYSGMIVPQVTKLISQGITAGLQPTLELQGYILGNPVTALQSDENSRVPFMHRLSLISDELYESAKHNCKGEYFDPDTSNSTCIEDIGQITQCTIKICDAQILEPKCSYSKPKPPGLNWGRKFFDEDATLELLRSPTKREENWCRNSNYVLSYMWANYDTVQEALNVRKVGKLFCLILLHLLLYYGRTTRNGMKFYLQGTILEWMRCNKSLAYDSNLNSTVSYHYDLLKDGYRALVYSGDHDMLIPHVGTEGWIYSLNMTVVDNWRPWFVDGQIAGYTTKFKVYLGDGLTYNTVKEGGHTAPEYKPKQCLEMADRWLSYYPM